MICNSGIHEEMKYKYSICPFCDKVNNERNRTISIRSPWAPVSINYVLRKLFVMLGLPSEDIKEKKTLKYYSKWWSS